MRKAIIVGLGLCITAAVQARIWTNREGQTIEAELVKVVDDQIYIRRAGTDKVRPYLLRQLSDEDQAFIADYLEKQAVEQLKAARANRKARWHDNFADAKAEADQFGYPILFLYTAPSWCGYCIKYENAVLDTPEFQQFANQNLVLLIADFSNNSDKDRWLEAHPELAKQYKIGGYPNTYFITSDKQRLGRLGGYDANWSTDVYIEKMKAIISKQ